MTAAQALAPGWVAWLIRFYAHATGTPPGEPREAGTLDRALPTQDGAA